MNAFSFTSQFAGNIGYPPTIGMLAGAETSFDSSKRPGIKIAMIPSIIEISFDGLITLLYTVLTAGLLRPCLKVSQANSNMQSDDLTGSPNFIASFGQVHMHLIKFELNVKF